MDGQGFLLERAVSSCWLNMLGSEAALQVDPRRGLQLEKLEADTVIVLCDGDTVEGSGWSSASSRR